MPRGRPKKGETEKTSSETSVSPDHGPGTSAAGRSSPDSAPPGYLLVHKSFWDNISSDLDCTTCRKKSVKVSTEKLSGLACKLVMYCSGCGVVFNQVTSSPGAEPTEREEPEFEVNKKFVKFLVEENKSYYDTLIFSKTLGIPCISKAMFEQYRDELLVKQEGN